MEGSSMGLPAAARCEKSFAGASTPTKAKPLSAPGLPRGNRRERLRLHTRHSSELMLRYRRPRHYHTGPDHNSRGLRLCHSKEEICAKTYSTRQKGNLSLALVSGR